MNSYLEKQSKYIPPSFLKTPDDSLNFVIYKGPSMNPTLKAGDILLVILYKDKKIKYGDVILFIPPGDDQKITHRVISIDSQGIRTKGDNNNHIDPWVLSTDEIIGRVVYAKLGNRRRRIYGGVLGRIYAKGIRTIPVIDTWLSFLLSPAYHWLAQLGIFRQWIPSRIRPRVLSFNGSAGTELQLVMGQRVVGRRLAGEKQWWIKRPFRLFINESSLP